MARSIAGYVLMGVGVVVSILSFPAVRTALKLGLPAGFNDNYVAIGGAVLLVVGAVLSFKSSQSQHVEVPIYHEDKIVGYRRHSA